MSGKPDDYNDNSPGVSPYSERKQDPLVDRLKPHPDSPVLPTRTMAGFFGNSDRNGYSRLYFTRELHYYAEFRTEDIVQVAVIPPEEAPWRGEQATRVVLKRSAEVAFTRVRANNAADQFDIDLRLRARTPRRAGGFARANGEESDLSNCCGTQPIDTCPTTVTACLTSCETDCVTGCPEMCRDTGGQFTCDPTCGTQITCPELCGTTELLPPPTVPSDIQTACVSQCLVTC